MAKKNLTKRVLLFRFSSLCIFIQNRLVELVTKRIFLVGVEENAVLQCQNTEL